MIEALFTPLATKVMTETAARVPGVQPNRSTAARERTQGSVTRQQQRQKAGRGEDAGPPGPQRRVDRAGGSGRRLSEGPRPGADSHGDGPAHRERQSWGQQGPGTPGAPCGQEGLPRPVSVPAGGQAARSPGLRRAGWKA